MPSATVWHAAVTTVRISQFFIFIAITRKKIQHIWVSRFFLLFPFAYLPHFAAHEIVMYFLKSKNQRGQQVFFKQSLVQRSSINEWNIDCLCGSLYRIYTVWVLGCMSWRCSISVSLCFLYTIIVVSGARSLYGELWLAVFVTCREYLCENVYSCVKETLSVPDVLHSSSALTPCQTAGLIWTHTSSFSRVASLFSLLSSLPGPCLFFGGGVVYCTVMSLFVYVYITVQVLFGFGIF